MNTLKTLRQLLGMLFIATVVAGCGSPPEVFTETNPPSPLIETTMSAQHSAPPSPSALEPSTVPPAASVTMEAAEPKDATTTVTLEAAATFRNPVLAEDFPDPGVLKVNGSFYAYATNASGQNVPVARSEDLVQWERLGDALPILGAWAQAGESRVWGPEVAKVGARYVLYYTAQDRISNRQCTGVATSATPEGPFQDTHADPLICRRNTSGWTIDPSPFVDGDKRYLYYGVITDDGTTLYVQELAADGLSVHGEATALAEADAPWEDGFVGGPHMWKQDGRYYLFFQGNHNDSLDRGIGYATCASPVGPCQDASENPILTSKLNGTPAILSPGGPAIVQTEDGRTWLLYHAGEIQGLARMLRLDRLDWNDGTPIVEGPTREPRPLP